MFRQHKDIVHFFTLIGVTIVATYYLPSELSFLWYLFLLILYYRSKNEALWLVLFFVLSDGFLSFFGLYEVTLKILPGIPGIELGQFYILISLFKIGNIKRIFPVFYQKALLLLGFYVIILILYGLIVDPPNEINGFFRIFKITFPLLLFYTIPRLLTTEEDYKLFFKYIFIVAISALVAQVFTLIIGSSPAAYLGVKEIGRLDERIGEEGYIARSFYNPGIAIIGFFGALYYIINNYNSGFKKSYLSLVIVSVYSMAYLSATRGWVVSLSVILLLYSIFCIKVKVKYLIPFIVLFFIFIYAGSQIDMISNQLSMSTERISSVGGIIKGEEAARETDIRTSFRSPMAIKRWKERPIFGWGFSETFFDYSDQHVGNQNLLIHGGLVGVFLILSFFLFFFVTVIKTGLYAAKNNLQSSSLLFVVFFIGWFILHSTSGQQFALYGIPSRLIGVVIFFSMGAMQYYKNRKIRIFNA